MKARLIPIPHRALLTTVVSAALMVITPPPIRSGNLWLSLRETPSLARGPISLTQSRSPRCHSPYAMWLYP